MKEKIQKYIEQNKDKLIHSIKELVQIKSLVGKEMDAQAYMKKKYQDLGLDIYEVEPNYHQLSKHEAFIDSGVSLEGRKNIIGIYRGKGNGRSLTLNGHVDVVPVEDLKGWTVDPWEGVIKGNKLYGRGAADMKSGLLANWFALKTLIELDYPIKGDIYLQSVIEEEAGGGGGTLACMEAGYLTDGFITTEPHNMNVTISHAGVMYFRIKVKGRTAHAGLAHEGVNAISKIVKIFNALEQLNQWRAKSIKFELYEKGSGQSVHLNIGTLKGGDWVSTVPGSAMMECRIGFIPGETREQIKELVLKTVNDAIADDEWFKNNPPEIEWFGWSTEPWYQNRGSLFVQTFLKSAKKTLDQSLKVIGRASANDARFTQYYEREGIAFGPIGENMHGPDECVHIDSVLDVAEVLANFIIEWTELK